MSGAVLLLSLRFYVMDWDSFIYLFLFFIFGGLKWTASLSLRIIYSKRSPVKLLEKRQSEPEYRAVCNIEEN
jgi:hypothetical protein